MATEESLPTVPAAAEILLASASPRRRELLTQIGVAHTVHPAHIDESRLEGEAPVDYVRRVALAKARAVQAQRPEATVLAADTTVVLDGAVLNKPVSVADAQRMLRLLAGRTHQVHTAVVLAESGREVLHVETTDITMTAIPEDELITYLSSGDSLDKAGGYGIQGYPARWISRIEGDYFNVVGLPLAATARLLRELAQK